MAKTQDITVPDIGGYDDVHASARYRRDLVRRIAPKLIGEVRACSA